MRMVAMLGVLLGGMAAAPAAQEGEAIPLRLHQGKQFTVEAVVAGKPRTFLFDTGEGVTMISPALASELGCEPWGNVTLFRMLGERMDLKRCDDVAFGIGAGRYTAPSVIVYDLAEINGKDGLPLDGAMGLDLFDGHTITIQFAEHRVIVETADSAKRRIRGATEVPARLSRPEGLGLDVNLGVRTARGLAWMELDTANAGPTIFVSQPMAPLFALNPATREPQAATLRLGEMTLETRARVFPDMIFDGNIGMQLVRDRGITLDLKGGRAWLLPPK
ncbi:MAG TPA: aspartyl protease family protein [Sphingomonas sp.]|nr:aspartyl protease family protein [Sphingomonas sp.]